VRSGNAPYFTDDGLSRDHWITQYYSTAEKRRITIDVDGYMSIANEKINPLDIKENQFDFAAKAWLDIRTQKDDALRFANAKPERGAIAVLWSLFYDFHSLMNNEIIYLHIPRVGTYQNFTSLSLENLKQIDDLAFLMLNPDENFEELKKIFDSIKDFRLLDGALL